MDAGLNALLWVVRLAFLLLLWIALGLMARTIVRDVMSAFWKSWRA